MTLNLDQTNHLLHQNETCYLRYLVSLNNLMMPEVIDMKAMVEEVLQTEGYSDKRAARLGKEDFLCLLAAFNSKGIHFA